MSEYLPQILSFVEDGLQVVSYKWLSRRFSISSNEAKRLLQEFVEEHGSKIDVIYVVSGWSKTNPHCYSVQLVPKAKLQESKAMLKGQMSCHVYSIQPHIPKDSAEIWSAEYVQSEEFFKQPQEVINCLRDNRFSAVSCLSIMRKVPGVSANNQLANSAQEKVVVKNQAPWADLESPIVHQSSLKPSVPVVFPSSPKPSVPQSDSREMRANQRALATSFVGTAADKNGIAITSKKRAPGFGEGALANLWGRASKLKPNPPEAQGSGVVQDQTLESGPGSSKAADDAGSDDDDAVNFANVRRGQARNGGARKRLVVFEDESSDDTEDEMVVRLASPEVHREEADMSMDTKRDTNDNERGSSPDKASLHPVKLKSSDIPKNIREKSLIKEDTAKQSDKSASTTIPKKRKVLKTHVDERGREVTEVVWENEDAFESVCMNEGLSKSAVGACASMETLKPLSSGPSATNYAPSKVHAKPLGKAAGKDSHQGKIFSFFKKKS